MSYTAINVEHLTKQYVLRHQQVGRYTALRDVLAEKAKSMFSGAGGKGEKEIFLALDDVSFSVQAGDRVGIVGRNGAGKSTLLKVLSRIVTPTKGRITLEGRIASLLEVGTGFHPELTGRENIFLNGAILGMSKAEITRKFDEIVAFAEVERFLDTPVKRYSSGMYVRLAFAVAAHLEPEILIVDEVLAVGDAAFQKKCLGRMREVAGEGRTVLFVSHNMEAVQKLCNTGILLNKGKLVASDTIERIVRQYLDSSDRSLAEYFPAPPAGMDGENGHVKVIRIEREDGVPSGEIPVYKPFRVIVQFEVKRKIEHFIVAIGISTMMDQSIRTIWDSPREIVPGSYKAIFHIDDIYLASGLYKLVVGLSSHERSFHYVDNLATFEIADATDGVIDERIVNFRSGLLLNQSRVEILPDK